MNGDLISRSALLEELNDTQYAWQDYDAVEGALRNIPAVDAVEVVRCKDCKHSRDRNEYEKNYLVEGVLICTHPDCSDDCWFATWYDHWCRYGERRGDE